MPGTYNVLNGECSAETWRQQLLQVESYEKSVTVTVGQ